MGAENGHRLTPIHLRILEILSDGLPHRPEELLPAIGDELADIPTLQVHICRIRKVLRPAGQDIIAEYVRRDCRYRHVRLLNFRE